MSKKIIFSICVLAVTSTLACCPLAFANINTGDISPTALEQKTENPNNKYSYVYVLDEIKVGNTEKVKLKYNKNGLISSVTRLSTQSQFADQYKYAYKNKKIVKMTKVSFWKKEKIGTTVYNIKYKKSLPALVVKKTRLGKKVLKYNYDKKQQISGVAMVSYEGKDKGKRIGKAKYSYDKQGRIKKGLIEDSSLRQKIVCDRVYDKDGFISKESSGFRLFWKRGKTLTEYVNTVQNGRLLERTYTSSSRDSFSYRKIKIPSTLQPLIEKQQKEFINGGSYKTWLWERGVTLPIETF